MQSPRRFRSALLILVAASFIQPAVGQSDRGTITGTVVDPAGARVPGVEVTVRSHAIEHEPGVNKVHLVFLTPTVW